MPRQAVTEMPQKGGGTKIELTPSDAQWLAAYMSKHGMTSKTEAFRALKRDSLLWEEERAWRRKLPRFDGTGAPTDSAGL
jgi:hypothetical protein